MPTDGLAYSALLKNELLGAGIEKVQDPQTEDRRLQPSTPEKKGLFTVSSLAMPVLGTEAPGLQGYSRLSPWPWPPRLCGGSSRPPILASLSFSSMYHPTPAGGPKLQRGWGYLPEEGRARPL